MTTTRVVLFDMGGVLLDFTGTRGLPRGKSDWRGREALLRFLAERGATLTEDDLDRLLFAPWRKEYERRRELGREADWTPHLKRLRKRARIRTPSIQLLGIWFRPMAEGIEAFAGARDVLEGIASRGLRMAVVSNVPLPGPLYLDILARCGLAEFFSRTYFSYDQNRRKPSPVMLRRALEDFGVGPEAAVMVGDRRSVDIAAGRAAGIRSVWLQTEDGGGPDPDASIRTLSELSALI